jgi:hypothetical protein
MAPLSKTRAAEPFQFSIADLLILTTIVAVCLGALLAAPGLGVLLIIVLGLSVVPAVIRARVARKRQPDNGGPRSPHQGRLVYLTSFLVTVAAVTLGLASCAAAAVIGFMMSCGRITGPQQSPVNDIASAILFFGSPVIGLMVAAFLYWAAWPRRRTAG